MDKLYNGMKIYINCGYEEVYFPEHPSASDVTGMVFVHRLLAEEYLGRNLRSGECVHHVDGIKDHNVITNLWVFKTNNDHTTYHAAVRHNLDFCLRKVRGVYTCKLLNVPVTSQTTCPICGKYKSLGASMCQTCYLQTATSNTLDRTELENLLRNHSYQEIGRMYNMTGNGIKKIAKKYGLYERCFVDCPDVNKLVEALLDGNFTSTARLFNVSVSTIKTWVKNNHIHIDDGGYVCVETGVVYINKVVAAKNVYPNLNCDFVSRCISSCCVSGEAYKGYHWNVQPKNVYIES